MQNETAFIFKINRDKPPAVPRMSKKMLPEKRGELMNAWQSALLAATQQKTRRVASELAHMISTSPYKDDCRIGEIFGNVSCVKIYLNAERKQQVLDFLFTHEALKKFPNGYHGYVSPKSRR